MAGSLASTEFVSSSSSSISSSLSALKPEFAILWAFTCVQCLGGHTSARGPPTFKFVHSEWVNGDAEGMVRVEHDYTWSQPTGSSGGRAPSRLDLSASRAYPCAVICSSGWSQGCLTSSLSPMLLAQNTPPAGSHYHHRLVQCSPCRVRSPATPLLVPCWAQASKSIAQGAPAPVGPKPGSLAGQHAFGALKVCDFD